MATRSKSVRHSTVSARRKPSVVPPSTPPPSKGAPAIPVGDPSFAEPTVSADPTTFSQHKNDTLYYSSKNLNPQVVPSPRNPANLTLSLQTVWGKQGAARIQALNKAGRIVFHSVGDTGSTKGPLTIDTVADKMVADFNEADPADAPSFFFHLGDVVYSFGESAFYYDQFYEPYRNYNAPILAIPGNHDGMTYTGDPEATLAAFLNNFCTPTFQKPSEAGGLRRTTMIQPGVYFALDAPFVRIIGLYSNALEDPGVISSQGGKFPQVGDQQLTFLGDQLGQLKAQNYQGAVILAVHHPPFSGGTGHGGSPLMLQEIDAQCQKAGFYPHAVFSGHAHNYQRFTRTVGQTQIPYLVAGCGGHNILPNSPVRTPAQVDSHTTIDRFIDEYGYLRVVVDAHKLRIEFHNVASGVTTKSPYDAVVVDLKTRKLLPG